MRTVEEINRMLGNALNGTIWTPTKKNLPERCFLNGITAALTWILEDDNAELTKTIEDCIRDNVNRANGKK